MRRPRALRRPDPRPPSAEPEARDGRLLRKPLSLTVVVPVRDGDADRLPLCLEPLASAGRRGVDLEVLVVHDGRGDAVADTVAALAERMQTAGVAVRRIEAPGETRAARLQTGARAALGEWLLFLRPESWLDPGWDATVVVFASEARNRDRAAVFTLAPLGRAEQAARAARAARFRNRWLGLPDGRQGFLIRRRHLSHLGGVPDLAGGEDLVLARRVGARGMALFDVAVRIEPDPSRSASANALKLALFTLRVPARWLQRLGD